MPYRWIEPTNTDGKAELHLWPHRSLTSRGFVTFFGATFALVSVPLLAVVGSPVLWGILPFFAICLGGMWLAIRRNDRDRSVFERLCFDARELMIERHDPGRDIRRWSTNPYWVRVDLHESAGPVPAYLTLKGKEREVEIGAFLSEDERRALAPELRRAFAKARAPGQD